MISITFSFVDNPLKKMKFSDGEFVLSDQEDNESNIEKAQEGRKKVSDPTNI